MKTYRKYSATIRYTITDATLCLLTQRRGPGGAERTLHCVPSFIVMIWRMCHWSQEGPSGRKLNWRVHLQGKYQKEVNKEMLWLVADSGSCFPLSKWSLKRLVAAEHPSPWLANSLTGDPFTMTAAGWFLTLKGVTQSCFQLGCAVL